MYIVTYRLLSMFSDVIMASQDVLYLPSKFVSDIRGYPVYLFKLNADILKLHGTNYTIYNTMNK